MPVDPTEIDDDRVAVAPVSDRELFGFGLHRQPTHHAERVFDRRRARDAGVLVEVERRERRLHRRPVESNRHVRADLLDGERLALRIANELEAVECERDQLVGGLRAGRRRVGFDRTLRSIDRAGHIVVSIRFVAASLCDHLLDELRFDRRSRRALADEIARERIVVRGVVGVPLPLRASWRRRLVFAEPLVAKRIDRGLVGGDLAIREAGEPCHGEVAFVVVDFNEVPSVLRPLGDLDALEDHVQTGLRGRRLNVTRRARDPRRDVGVVDLTGARVDDVVEIHAEPIIAEGEAQPERVVVFRAVYRYAVRSPLTGVCAVSASAGVRVDRDFRPLAVTLDGTPVEPALN